MTRVSATATLALLLAGCASTKQPPANVPPPQMIGVFEDDYGIRYTIDRGQWRQIPSAVYDIVNWNVPGEYLVAVNDSSNSTDQGLYTRIDWVELDASPDYPWAFCYTVYSAESARDAQHAQPANRNAPRSGCNGFPFSRMRRVQ